MALFTGGFYPIPTVLSPVQIVCTPVQFIYTPVEIVCTPVQIVCTRVEIVFTPVQFICTRVEIVCTPVQIIYTPVEIVCTPVEIVMPAFPAIVGGGEAGKNLVALPRLTGYYRASIREIFGISSVWERK